MVLPPCDLASSHGATAVNTPSPRAFTPLSTTLTLVSRATRSNLLRRIGLETMSASMLWPPVG